MHASLRWVPAAALSAVALAVPSAGRAAPQAEEKAAADACPRPDKPHAPCGRAAAAALFDEGVRAFQDAEFGPAARAFLEADDAAASEDAVKNAIVAARRAAEWKLLAEGGKRASQRSSNELARLGREALADATTHLARIEVRCARVECRVEVDGERAGLEPLFALPGTHRIVAASRDGERTERIVACEAGMAYRFDLDEPAAPVHDAKAPPAVAPGKPGKRPQTGLPPAVFYASAGLTAVLTGLVIASGVDAIDAKDAMPNPPTTPERDDVLGRARRTDALLGGAIAAGALTAALGVWFVKWAPTSTSQARGARGRRGCDVAACVSF